MHNPFIAKTVKVKSIKSEKALAKKVGGFRCPASGAGGIKGDVQLDGYLLDLKQTQNSSISIKLEDLVKATREANGVNKTPALVIKFEKVAAGVASEWLVIPLEKL